MHDNVLAAFANSAIVDAWSTKRRLQNLLLWRSCLCWQPIVLLWCYMHICGVETFCVFGLIIHFNAHGIFHRSTSSEDETECQWIEMLCARACFTVNYMQCRARSARPANTHTQNRFSINRQCSSWALFPFYVMLRCRARWLTQIYFFFFCQDLLDREMIRLYCSICRPHGGAP